MTVAEHVCVDGVCSTVWCVIQHLYDLGGVSVFGLIFVAYTFNKLVWRVWSASMQSKAEEIQRLIEERSFFRSRLFPDDSRAEP